MPRRISHHANLDDEAVDRVLGALQPLSREPLDREYGREALGNLLDLVHLLQRWDADDRARAHDRAGERDPGGRP